MGRGGWGVVSEGVLALTADKSPPERRVLIDGRHSAACGGVLFSLLGTFFSAQCVDDFATSAGNREKRNCDLASSEQCGGFRWFVLLSLWPNV